MIGSKGLLATAAIVLLFVAALVGGPAGAGHVPGNYFDLGALPPPGQDGAAILAGQEAFVNAHPFRIAATPTEILASVFLRDDAASLGYEASIQTVPLATPEPLSTVAPLHLVTALKRGTTLPDEWILFIAHYDTIPTTIYGAYDNGSGSNLLRYLARAIADVPTNRSIAFVWYSGEEEGALASWLDSGKRFRAKQNIAAVLGFDMVGIAWPVGTETAESCLCMWHGENDENLRPLLEEVNFDFLGFPNSPTKVSVRGLNDRNSDESSFDSFGYQTLRWAGLLKAASYPAYHAFADTFDTIFEVAGGRSFFEAGLENTLKSAYYTALALDNHPPTPSFTSSLSGATASFDASVTTDLDGPPSGYAWDFGDGATGSGASPTHSYSDPGTYTVTLMVADNLWPSVTRSTSATVTVD
jgi:hypothetical protein